MARVDKEISIAENRTLKMLYDAREHVNEVRREAIYQAKVGHITDDVANELIGNAVVMWLDHVIPFLHSNFRLDDADVLWNEVQLGTVVVDPREDFEQCRPYDIEPEKLELGAVAPAEIVLEGIQSIANGQPATEQSVSASWGGVEVSSRHREHAYEEVDVIATRTIPLRVWKTTINKVDRWLQDVGLAVDLDKPRAEAEVPL